MQANFINISFIFCSVSHVNIKPKSFIFLLHLKENPEKQINSNIMKIWLNSSTCIHEGRLLTYSSIFIWREFSFIQCWLIWNKNLPIARLPLFQVRSESKNRFPPHILKSFFFRLRANLIETRNYLPCLAVSSIILTYTSIGRDKLHWWITCSLRYKSTKICNR